MYSHGNKRHLFFYLILGTIGIFASATGAEILPPPTRETLEATWATTPTQNATNHARQTGISLNQTAAATFTPTGSTQANLQANPGGAATIGQTQITGNTGVNAEEIPLVGVFMVKDEEHIIKQTLEPYIDGGIKHFFIFDTGSTDKTIEVARAYFQERGITQYGIAQEPFIDFATSRNRGLDLARQKFPTAAFLTMPDAEWYLRNGEKLVEFCKEHAHKNLNVHSYSVRIMNANIDFYTPRLIRNDNRHKSQRHAQHDF